jgi:hypothetical protein
MIGKEIDDLDYSTYQESTPETSFTLSVREHCVYENFRCEIGIGARHRL